MKDLTLIIPTKKEVESLPVFLREINNLICKKLVVLQKEDIETINAISEFNNIKILLQKKNGYGNALIEGIKNVDTKFRNFRVLYGGSVKSSNSNEITELSQVDGCFIGGASLKVDEFNTIIS